MRLVEGRESRVEGRSTSRKAGANGRAALTLVELLITILIISILAAAVLGVAAVAGETAREARTQNMVARIHTLLLEHADTYKSRRVKLRPEVLAAINDPSRSVTVQQRNREKAQARLFAMRELMLMELPQRWSDVLLADVPGSPQSYFSSGGLRYPIYLAVPSASGSATIKGRPGVANVYLRRYAQIAGAKNKVTGLDNTDDEILANEGAECLYMIVMNACGDGEARTLFNESSIGDVDGDGAPEFLDGWGRPIEFLRWAPGYESEIQANANLLDNPATGTAAEAWAEAAGRDHDPFDVFRSEVTAFRLVPLVISAGRDNEFGIQAPNYMLWQGIDDPDRSFTVSGSPLTPQLTPYLAPASPDRYAGTKLDATATDNIHNHLISTR